MAPAPAKIGGLRVLYYSPIDARHRFTGANERRYVGGHLRDEILFGPMAGLAVCKGPVGVQLLGCDAEWRPQWMTSCTATEIALEQAEFEYEGISMTWVTGGS